MAALADFAVEQGHCLLLPDIGRRGKRAHGGGEQPLVTRPDQPVGWNHHLRRRRDGALEASMLPPNRARRRSLTRCQRLQGFSNER
jgi:hypothetical protein